MMERLTQRAEVGKKVFFSDDACFLCGYNKERSSTFCENIGCKSTIDRSCPYLAVIDRLAAYEDTGLTPEEVKDMAENAETRLLTWFEAKYGFPVGKLMDFCEAEEQGRLVVLPCKWGTKLYSIYAELYHLNEDGEPPIKEVWLVENNVCVIIRQFGKTVFLTREEAENALRGGAER